MPSRCEDYTVGWICALDDERVAAVTILDERYPREEEPDIDTDKDHNSYMYGRIHEHRVVIAGLGTGRAGLTDAAIVAEHMTSSFPNINIKLMVGVAGGAPSETNDIRIGDIVVSTPALGNGGVLQFDWGRDGQGTDFKATGHTGAPPRRLLNAVGKLQGIHKLDGHKIKQTIKAMAEKNLRLDLNIPEEGEDRLYRAAYTHKEKGCHCKEKDRSSKAYNAGLKFLVPNRAPRRPNEDDPKVHRGLIASSNSLMKNAYKRDQIARKHEVLCFEMESAGLMNSFACLVIRGISDYADTHKHDQWKLYAAFTAAVYAKELLGIIPCKRNPPGMVYDPPSGGTRFRTERPPGPSRSTTLVPNSDIPFPNLQNLDEDLEDVKRLSSIPPDKAISYQLDKLVEDEELLDEAVDYWSHLTLKAYRVYEDLYGLMCKQSGEHNISWFSRCLGNKSPGLETLLALMKHLPSKPLTEEPLPACYVFALLYMVHVEHFSAQCYSERDRLKKEQLKALRSFTTWTPCNSPGPECEIEWNFVGKPWGMLRTSHGHITTDCLVYKRYLEREASKGKKVGTKVPTSYDKHDREAMDKAHRELYKVWYSSGWREKSSSNG